MKLGHAAALALGRTATAARAVRPARGLAQGKLIERPRLRSA